MGLRINTVERIIQRFVVKTDTCWHWTGKTDYDYGRVSMGGTDYRAHRLIYEALTGPIADGLVLDHLCRNHGCVNPAHLEPVTQQENVRRGDGAPAKNALKTHCVYGHELSGDNLYQYTGTGTSNIWRGCKICRRAAVRRNREKQAA